MGLVSLVFSRNSDSSTVCCGCGSEGQARVPARDLLLCCAEGLRVRLLDGESSDSPTVCCGCGSEGPLDLSTTISAAVLS